MTAVDTSIVVGSLLAKDEGVRQRCRRVLDEHPALLAHVFVESFSVLTRLPPPVRLSPRDAAAFLSEAFTEEALTPSPAVYRSVVEAFTTEPSAEGRVYDAHVAATAKEQGQVLLTRDRRAASTYLLLAADFAMV